jgi:hypothetical protein
MGRLDQEVEGSRRPQGLQKDISTLVPQAQQWSLPSRIRSEHRLALLPVGTRHGIGVAEDEVLDRESIQPLA